MMGVRSLLAGLACLGLAACGEEGASTLVAKGQLPSLPNEGEIAEQFDTWNAALQTGDPKRVAALYAKNGVLLPTVSNKVRSSGSQIEDYFEHFLKLRPRGRIDEQHITVLDENTAINQGVYTFDVVRESGPDKVQARYSYVYEKIGDRWLIMSHHSSAMPEKVEKVAEAGHGDEHGEEKAGAAGHGGGKGDDHGGHGPAKTAH